MARREGFCSAGLGCMLKLFNFVLAFVGVALLLFSLWLLHKLLSPPDLTFSSSQLWFVHLLLGLGTSICIIALIGHLAAETANGCCLSCYAFLVVVLLILQSAFTAEILLNKNWDKVVPNDPTGVLACIRGFVEEDLDVCKWTGLVIVIIEVLAAFFALCAKCAASSCVDEENDDDYEDHSVYAFPISATCRQPLLGREKSNMVVPINGYPYRSGFQAHGQDQRLC